MMLALNRLKRYDGAQKLIETAIQLNPDEAAGDNIYGLIIEQNRLPEAAQFERALQLKTGFTQAKGNLKKLKGE